MNLIAQYLWKLTTCWINYDSFNQREIKAFYLQLFILHQMETVWRSSCVVVRPGWRATPPSWSWKTPRCRRRASGMETWCWWTWWTHTGTCLPNCCSSINGTSANDSKLPDPSEEISKWKCVIASKFVSLMEKSSCEGADCKMLMFFLSLWFLRANLPESRFSLAGLWRTQSSCCCWRQTMIATSMWTLC